MNKTVSISVKTVCILVILVFPGINIASSSLLILKNADFNRNSMVNGNWVSVLQGNVIFEYDDAVIKADQATWYRSTGIALFSDNIHITMKNQTLMCEKMRFNKNDNTLIARQDINFFDQKEQIRILAQHGSYALDSKKMVLTGDPMLFNYDTLAAETLIISGETMTYDDSMKVATVVENVVIEKGLLESTCSTATYDMNTNVAKLRNNPLIFYDIHDLHGDSVDLFFTDKKLRGIAIMRNSAGTHKDIDQSDTIVTKVTGDSMYINIAENGSVKDIWTHENASTVYYTTQAPETVNNADGKIMVLNFTEGKTGNVKIFGNASCTYHVDDDTESGRNEASGDTIFIHFDKGKADYIRMSGAVRGTYFAEIMNQ